MNKCRFCEQEIPPSARFCHHCGRTLAGKPSKPTSPKPAPPKPVMDQQGVKDQIGKLTGGARLLGRKEIKELPNILWGDETLTDIVQGVYDDGQGILVATNKRLIFINKGMIYGLKVEDFPYDKMSSIQYETKLMFGSVTIFASGNKAMIRGIAPKARASAFAEGVRARLEASKPPAPAAGLADYDELERLAGLKEKGIVTQEEFDAKKKQILGL